ELWRVGAITFNREILTPQYWRMFTLVKYNGKSWSQASGSGRLVTPGVLDEEQWPFIHRDRQFRFSPQNEDRPRRFEVEGFNVNIPLRDGKTALYNFGADQHHARVLIESRA